MNVFKNLLLTSLSVSALFIATSHASTVTTAQLADNYVGSDGRRISTTDSYGGSDYDIHWMQVSRAIEGQNTVLTVSVNTGFVKKNDINGDGGIKFGDLFLMDGDNYDTDSIDECNDGSGRVGCNEFTEQTTSTSRTIHSEQAENQWEYAFDLGSARRDSYSDHVNKSGTLRDLSQVNTSITDPDEIYEQSVTSTTENREWQAIMSNDSKVNNSVGSGSWKTLIGDDLLVMTFDITGTALADADQIALRWAMTCANDIIEVVANLANTPPVDIPEPTTLMLIFSSVIGLSIYRKRSINNL